MNLINIGLWVINIISVYLVTSSLIICDKTLRNVGIVIFVIDTGLILFFNNKLLNDLINPMIGGCAVAIIGVCLLLLSSFNKK